MTLITDEKDARFIDKDQYTVYDHAELYRDSLRAALKERDSLLDQLKDVVSQRYKIAGQTLEARAERDALQAQLCAARELMQKMVNVFKQEPSMNNRIYDNLGADVLGFLSSPSPCRHEAEADALRAERDAAIAERDALREAVEELFLSRKEYADKAAGAQYGAVWARYMNAFCVLERELRRRADAAKGGKG